MCLFLCFPFSLSQFVVIASTVTSSGLKYDDYVFPHWANVVGWGVAMSSMMFVPGYAIYKFLSVKGTFKQVSMYVCIDYCSSILSDLPLNCLHKLYWTIIQLPITHIPTLLLFFSNFIGSLLNTV